MAGDINLRVEADTSQAVDQVNKLEKSLDNLSKNAVDTSLNKVNSSLSNSTKYLSETALAAGKLDSTLSKSANSATKSLTGLGTAASTTASKFQSVSGAVAPIANSLSTLSTESNSTVNAIGSLAGQFLSGGILSVAIRAGVLLIGGLIKSFQDTEPAISKLSYTVAEFASVTRNAKTDLESFNKELEFSKQLGDSQIEIAFGKGFKSDLTKLQADFIGNQEKVLFLVNQQTSLTENLSKATDQFYKNASKDAKDLHSNYTSFLDISDDLIGQLSKDDQAYFKIAKNAAQALIEIQGKLNDARNAGNVIGAKNAALRSDEARKEAEDARKKAEAEAKRIADLLTEAKVLKALQVELELLSQKEIQLKTDESRKKIAAIEKAIDDLVKKVGLANDSKTVLSLFAQIRDIQLEIDEKVREKFRQEVREKLAVKKMVLPAEVKLQPRFTGLDNAIEKSAESDIAIRFSNIPKYYQKAFQDAVDSTDFNSIELERKAEEIVAVAEQLAKDSGQIVGQAFTDAFSGIGEMIGNALSGGSLSIKDVFGGLFKIFGSAIKELGIKVIEASTLIQALKKAFPAGQGVIVGIALVALGTIIQNATIPGFADGVQNFSGGVALVGERGPELVNLPKGSDVIPNHKLGSVAAGEPIVFIADTRIEGNNIVLSYNRTTKTQGRNS